MSAQLTGVLALAITAAALVAGALALVVTRRPTLALAVLLDLLLAAGLLRLAGGPDWESIGTAAAVVVLRRLIGVGLRAGRRAWSPPGPAARSGAGSLRSLSVESLVRPAWRL